MNDFVSNTLEGMPLRFDYTHLVPESVLYVKRKTNEVRTLNQNKGKRVYGNDVFAIGAILLEVRKRMSQPLFYAWLETEAQISRDIAARYMAIVRKFGRKASKLQNLSFSALDELTRPSYPPAFLEKVLSGEYVPNALEVKRMRIHQKEAPCQETGESTISSEAEQQITELQNRIQELIEDNTALSRELDIANKVLEEKDKEIMEKDIKIDKLNRLVMTMKQVCNEN